MVTGFVQVNIGHTIKADAGSNSPESYVFDLHKNIDSMPDLLPGSLDATGSDADAKKNTLSAITVNALKIAEKTIVIKGYNENIDNALLDTINLDIQNLNNISTTTSYGVDMTPITINMSLADEVTQLSDDENGDIVEYEVAPGDNLSSIANKYNISVDTILWANDLNSKSSIQVGQKLVILPVSGLSYKVKSGDTVSGLAAKFGISEREIVDFNKTEDNKLVIGETIIIPGGKISGQVSTPVKTSSNGTKPSTGGSNNAGTGSMARPIGPGAVKTQGIHGHNGIDFGAPLGTQVYAALDGVVTLIRGGDAWNGGYGNYIVLKHANGIQTLYAHLGNILVSPGQTVKKGESIGRSGNSGESTGPHLHFEVRGAKNPF